MPKRAVKRLLKNLLVCVAGALALAAPVRKTRAQQQTATPGGGTAIEFPASRFVTAPASHLARVDIMRGRK